MNDPKKLLRTTVLMTMVATYNYVWWFNLAEEFTPKWYALGVSFFCFVFLVGLGLYKTEKAINKLQDK